jgi:glycosyltransferase involved in cell wall biosynthesis
MTDQLFINGRFLAQPQTGTQRYAVELLKALDELIDSGQVDLAGVSLTILAPPEKLTPLALKHINIREIGWLKGNLWEQICLPWFARHGLLFSPCNIGPILHGYQAVTIHDASVFASPESYSRAFRWKYATTFKVLSKTAKHVITDSIFSRDELIRVTGMSPEKIQVVSLGREHILEIQADTSIFNKYQIGSKPYILAVSSNSPHKNFPRLVEAVGQLGHGNYDVVIVGGTFSKVFQTQEFTLSPFVKRIGYISDGELCALYERAACFVYPSYYEGFGLPPLEAMTLGCPAAVSKAASLPEVCGDAVDYFNPFDVPDIAQTVFRLATDPQRQEMLRQRGFVQSKLFSWKVTAAETWKCLSAFLN